MGKAAKIVSSSIIGMDFKTVLVGGRSYVIFPPTIRKIAGASFYLSSMDECHSIEDVIRSLSNIKDAAHALSWFISGSDDISEELMDGTLDEVIEALVTAYSMVSIEDFQMLSALSRNVSKMTANQR